MLCLLLAMFQVSEIHAEISRGGEVASEQSQQSQKRCSGVVIAKDDGQPLIGVAVMLKGTSKGAVKIGRAHV